MPKLLHRARKANSMRRLLLVGDKPSRKNLDPKVAFVGTQSFKTIQKWLEFMLKEKTAISMINRVDPEFAVVLIRASLRGYKIIAFGEEAAKALVQNGVVNYFKLPHPSGRNRKLNNKKYVEEVLTKCKNWIEED